MQATTAKSSPVPPSATNCHSVPPSATYNQVLSVGFDPGNGSSKLVVDLSENRQPSYVLRVERDRLLDIRAADDGGMVEYISGDRHDLTGSIWLTGSLAYQQSPTGCLRVVDSGRGKIEYGLQLLLGGLSTFSHREEWHLSAIASIQDQQVCGDELRAALEGSHRVRLGNRPECTVFITVQRVLEEGAAAIVNARSLIDPEEQSILLDLGSGTSIISVFGPKGKLINRKVSPGGVEQLIDAIATNIDTRKHLGQEGDRQIIRAGIERGDFRYGKTAWNFEPIYKAELKGWIASVLAPAIKAAAPWLPTSAAFIAIGGGSQLPMVGDLLKLKAIQVVPEGHWANCRGMARIAHLTLKGAK